MNRYKLQPELQKCLSMTELPSHEYISTLSENASSILENELTQYRPADTNGKPGSLLELSDLPAVVIPDLHARPGFIKDILNYLEQVMLFRQNLNVLRQTCNLKAYIVSVHKDQAHTLKE